MKVTSSTTAYITGGSSGIGLAAAKHLAAAGANVIIFSRNQERLNEAAAAIKKQCLPGAQVVAAIKADVTDRQEVEKVFSRALEQYGAPDLLINCAGLAYPHYFEQISFEKFDETMKTNLYGVWNVTQRLVPAMKQKGGHIVNVSSIAGFIGIFGYTAYSASKFAVIGFSEALRSELKRFGIKVSVLCPPDSDTPGFAAENETKPPETKEVSKGAKLMTPAEVAAQMAAGLEKEKFMIIPGFDGQLTWRLKRFLPALVDKILSAQVEKVHKRQKLVSFEGRS